ncbi:lipid II:glycine glycyltransferase FemX [Pseudonocardia spinosispora]|uniref:lipid II:glycine glycyltransferase FemX n=1 Tax=Pseudonocardia spinosispora TaxID=103441 RepID=UPI00041933FA|nr:GNAT family N-acetyltransferase [Pseudonocardia spinosispora]
MQVPPASKAASVGSQPTKGGSAKAGRAGVTTADRTRAKQLLDDLKITISSAPEQELLTAWDELVATTHNTDVSQLSGWATVRKQAEYEPLYVLASSGPWLLGGAMVLRRKIRGLGWVGYLPYGPVLSDDLVVTRGAVRHRLAGALTKVARAHLALFVQPPDGGDDTTLDLLQNGFRFSKAGIAPAATMRVDLTQTDEELLSGLTRRLRTWTRQWPQRGVKVRVGDERDIPLLARLAASTAEYQGFTPFPTEYLEATYHELLPGGHVVLLIGELDGTPVAAELLSGSGGVLKSRITGLDRTSKEAAKLNVASAMIWEAICWGKANGYRAYDFGGLRPESVELLRGGAPVDQEALPGPDLFKTKFGGEVWIYPPAVELIASRTIRAGYDVLRRGDGGQKLITFVRETLRGGR